MTEFRGLTLSESISKAAQNEGMISTQTITGLSTKRASQIWAPPFKWGPWVEVFAILGAVGPNKDKIKRTIKISFNAVNATSPFGVEIKFGSKLVKAIGPGSAKINIVGNVAGGISMRCKSTGPMGQDIRVNAR